MKKFIVSSLLILGVCAPGRAQTTRPQPDVRTFELTAIAPPTPVLKYQLLFDDLADRRSGNAALLYMDSILLAGPQADEKTSKALDAYAAKDTNTFNELADSLEAPSVFQELNLAARCEQCDWQPPYREMGAYTLLPHLGPLAHPITRMIKVRALRRVEQGRIDEALITLRLGYELSDKVGCEPILISGLVSIAITTQMNDALASLMSHPQSPNLYWALAEFPARQSILRHAMDGERAWLTTSIRGLAKLRAGEELSADQWRQLFDEVWKIHDSDTNHPAARPDPVKGSSQAILKQAREHYVQARHVSAEQAAAIDPIVVLGRFYYDQYQVNFDQQYSMRGLPYATLLPLAREYASRMEKLRQEQPANPFEAWGAVTNFERFARVDRQLAAMTAVEAIRSYAAAHGGALPAHLEDVTQTPVPANPMTGSPFEYQMTNNSAILSDSRGEGKLKYTITLRK